MFFVFISQSLVYIIITNNSIVSIYMKIIQSLSNSTAFNLAAELYLFHESVDEFLLAYVNEPSVVIGANQVINNEVNIQFCKEQNIQLYRRVSGGGAVYHDYGNLNYSFISNKEIQTLALGSDFLNPVVAVLNSLNIPVEIGQRKDLWLKSGYKISGTASHFSKNRVLQHGTLLYDSNLIYLQTALNSLNKDETQKGTASVPSPVKNLRSYLNEENCTTVDSEMFFNQLLELLSVELNAEKRSFTQAEILEINKIAHSKFTSDKWTYKK